MTKKNNQPKSKFFTSVLNYFMRKKNNSSTEEEVSTIKPEDDKSFLDYYSKSLVYRDKFLIDSKSKRIPEIINYSVNDNTDISPLFKIESILDKLTKTITNLLQTGNSTKLSKQINNINNITNIKKIPIFSYRNESDNFKYLPVPSFAEGGMASQPTLAIVGDSSDNKPEYVIGEEPLKQTVDNIIKSFDFPLNSINHPLTKRKLISSALFSPWSLPLHFQKSSPIFDNIHSETQNEQSPAKETPEIIKNSSTITSPAKETPEIIKNSSTITSPTTNNIIETNTEKIITDTLQTSLQNYVLRLDETSKNISSSANQDKQSASPFPMPITRPNSFKGSKMGINAGDYNNHNYIQYSYIQYPRWRRILG